MNDKNFLKRLYIAVGYGTNICYFITLLTISIFVAIDKNPYYSLIIFGIPALISMIISTQIIRKNNQNTSQCLLKLVSTHIISLVGLVAAIIYLFF